MPLKIIGAGFGRTGTLSLKAALEQLGYVKTHHMLEVLSSSNQTKLWNAIGNGEAPNWDFVFDGFEACVDFPASPYYKELMAHFPDAKIILTVRDVDKWYKSTSRTIYRLSTIIPKWARVLIPKVGNMHNLAQRNVWQKVFNGRFDDEDYAKTIFQNHIQEVKAIVPSEKLLVFEVSQGWEPLCAFLELPVPDGPFPHLNDSARMLRIQKYLQFAFTIIPMLLILVILAGLYFLVFPLS